MAKSTERKVWVLDTETKGTGAEMVPLEKLQERRRSRPSTPRLTVVRSKESTDEEEFGASTETADARRPRRFKVVNVITQQVRAEDVGGREAVEALRAVPSVVDVRVYVWQPAAEEWRPLTFGEQKTLWAFREP